MRVLVLTCILSLVCSRLEAQAVDGDVETPAEQETDPAAEEGAESAPEEVVESTPEEVVESAPEEAAESAPEEAVEPPAPEEGAEPEAVEDTDPSEGEEEESYDEDEEDSFYDEEGEMFDEEEESSGRSQIFLIGPGLGLGFFFDAKSINDYIEDWQTTVGKSDSDYSPLRLNYIPRIVFNFVPVEYVQPQILFEVGIGPKIAKKESGTKTFHVVRGSIGGLMNFHLPIREKYSLFVGAGALLHVMKFEERTATDWGFRGQLGFRWYKGGVVPEIFVAFDHIEASDVSDSPEVDSGESEEEAFKRRGVEFDLTGLIIGVNVLFNAT